MSNVTDLAHAVELSIDIARLKERLDEISPILTAYRWYNAASNAEEVLASMDNLTADMEKVVAMLRDRVHAAGVR